ncbi:Hpt domain-containing protein [Paenibacillus rhizoplanae]
MMMELSAYRDIFIEELNEQLERIDQSLLALEHAPTAELIQTIFRAAHTIKGSASTMGFREMSDLTHEVEYALEWVREKKPEITGILIDTLFRALDAMKLLRSQYVSGGEFTDCSAVVAEIKALINKPAEAQPVRLPVLDAAERLQAEEAVAAGYSLLALVVTLREDCQMKAARHYILLQRIEEVCGPVIATALAPPPAPGADEDVRYSQFAVVAASPREIRQVSEQLAGGDRCREYCHYTVRARTCCRY